MLDSQLVTIKQVLKELQTSFPEGIVDEKRSWGPFLFLWKTTGNVLTLDRTGYAQLRIGLEIGRVGKRVEGFFRPNKLLEIWPSTKVFIEACLEDSTLPLLTEGWRLVSTDEHTVAPVEVLEIPAQDLERAIKIIPKCFAKLGYQLLTPRCGTWIMRNDEWSITLDRMSIDSFRLVLVHIGHLPTICLEYQTLHEIVAFLEKFIKENHDTAK